MEDSDRDAILAGGGEMGARMRAFDWEKTPLGPVTSWPQPLRTCVRIILTSRQPMFVWWGDDLINLYNDAYKAIVGGKHPEALGQPASVVWREIWDQVWPRVQAARIDNEGTYDEALLLIMERNGYPEETYYTFSYSPVPNDHGGPAGIICANTDDTPRIIGARRLALMRELAARTGDARSLEEACARGVASLATNPRDLPFALLYMLEPGERQAVLAGAEGIARGHAAAPEVVPLGVAGAAAPWPIAEVARSHAPVLVGDLPSRFADLPAGPWPRPPAQAMALPITGSARGGRAGVLVVGLNPFRPPDDDYRTFLNLVAGQLSAGIAHAAAYEEERRRAEELAELDRAKTAFFGNVSHEFRTPLTLMLGPLRDQLEGARGELPAPLRDDAEVVHRNAVRLLRLVNSLLDFSRIEAGRMQASYQATDLASLTRDLGSVFRSAIERAGLTFSIDCPPLAEPFFVDRGMWEKIVLNLLSNAFKFTFEGGVSLSLRPVAGGGAVALRVQDSGVGVPPDELPRLFERFHRVEGTRARTHEGSGIGLALVQELVKMHGGAIVVESEVDRGTTFTVTVPAGAHHLPAAARAGGVARAAPAPDASAYVEEALRWLPEEGGAAGAGGGDSKALASAAPAAPAHAARIVLADDNADMRDYVGRLLRQRWQVESVADGAAALAAARARPPDLVLTDVMMPRLDGFGLLRALRADPRTRATPVIMLSARAGEEAKVVGLEAGADDYLVKPFSARELMARVETHLALSRLRAAAETERARLHTLFMSAPTAMAILDGPEHRFELANPLYRRLIGEREPIGRAVRDVLPELVDQGFVAILDDVYRTGKPHAGEETRLEIAGLGELYLNFVCQPRFGPDGRVDGVIFFGFEVTPQVLARREIEGERRLAEQARDVAEAAVRARDDFMSIASHELRTPLTSLCLQVDSGLRMMRRHGAPPAAEVLARLEKIRLQAGRLELLVQGLLDVTRLAAGRLELRLEDVDLAEIARDVGERLRDEAERVGSPIVVHAEAPVRGRWDAMRLDQVVTNLLSNAIKYGLGNPIDLSVERTPRGTAVVRVHDRGMGIAPGDHARIFERFERAVSDRNLGGLGLGLWIARQFVENMGGTITVGSQPGQGATFAVELPAAAPQPSTALPRQRVASQT